MRGIHALRKQAIALVLESQGEPIQRKNYYNPVTEGLSPTEILFLDSAVMPPVVDPNTGLTLFMLGFHSIDSQPLG